jgi:hypothetical protein
VTHLFDDPPDDAEIQEGQWIVEQVTLTPA